jgi:hypothetical protein
MMAPCVAKYVWFRKEPSREGRSGKMLEETLLEYTYLSSVVGVIVRRERRWPSAGATPVRELVRSTR